MRADSAFILMRKLRQKRKACRSGLAKTPTKAGHDRMINACLALGFADQPDHVGEKKRKPRASRGFQVAKSSI
jgi:hypothetical protein